MTWKRIVEVHDNQIVLNLPSDFDKKKVLIVIEEISDAKISKLERMQQAANDPLFLADIDEVQTDFGPVDGEIV